MRPVATGVAAEVVREAREISGSFGPHLPTRWYTGVSGSAKSSLVLDTIAAESQRLISKTA